jgi:hypothetical protein
MISLREYSPIVGYGLGSTVSLIGAFYTGVQAELFFLHAFSQATPLALREPYVFAGLGALMVTACLLASCAECFLRARSCMNEMNLSSLQGRNIHAL